MKGAMRALALRQFAAAVFFPRALAALDASADFGLSRALRSALARDAASGVVSGRRKTWTLPGAAKKMKKTSSGPTSTNFLLAERGQRWPMSSSLGPMLTEVGQNWA